MKPDNIKILIESRRFLAKATRESNERYEKTQKCAELRRVEN